MAAAPAGPRLAVVKVGPKGSVSGLLNVAPNGGKPLRLVGGGRKARPLMDYFSTLSWSADGEMLAFSGILGFQEGDDNEPIRRIFTVGADGSGLRRIPKTNGATNPVLSPDGRTLAFTRGVDRETPTTIGGRQYEEFHGSSIWTIDLQTGTQSRLTPWRDEVYYTGSSFSPDGSTLLATHEDALLLNEPEPVALRLDGSGSRRLLNDGFSPVYSPDGSKIVLARYIEEYGEDRGTDVDLFVVDADGTDLLRLTRTPRRSELYPSWDPSGERLAFVRIPENSSEEAPFGFRTPLMQINADGSCETQVVSRPNTYFFAPTWQPGPGRGAGRIEC
jgi:TolB protein